MALLQRLSVQMRLIVMVALFTVGVAGLALVSASQQRSTIMTERQAAVQAEVETGLSVIQHYGAAADAGELSVEQAQQLALETIKELRYSGEEYFWINDMHPTMIMHPFKPELDGEDLTENVDPNGKHLFVEFVNEVQAHGAGFVDYMWPKPGMEDPQPKISYVAGYAPWDWIIGSGVYVDDVASASLSASLGVLGFGALLVVLVLGASWFISRSVSAQIQAATSALESGDLSTRLPVGRGKTELEQMAVALNATLDRSEEINTHVRSVIGRLNSSADQLAATSEQIAAGSEQTLVETSKVVASAEDVSTGMDVVAAGAGQLEQSIKEIAVNTNNVAQIAQEAVVLAQATNDAVVTLGESSAEIGSVVKVITAIAEQTNLLALNATIEAARAGDAGKGFAVVAGEVKELAEETSRATGDISTRITSIQEAVDLAATEIAQIGEIIGRINDFQTTIASAVEEQNATAAEMAQSISVTAGGGHAIATSLGDVRTATQQTSSDLEAIRAAAAELAALAGDLDSRVAVG